MPDPDRPRSAYQTARETLLSERTPDGYWVGELSASGVALSELLRPFRRYHASGEINTRVDDPIATIEEIAAAFPEGRQDRLDGLTKGMGHSIHVSPPRRGWTCSPPGPT